MYCSFYSFHGCSMFDLIKYLNNKKIKSQSLDRSVYCMFYLKNPQKLSSRRIIDSLRTKWSDLYHCTQFKLVIKNVWIPEKSFSSNWKSLELLGPLHCIQIFLYTFSKFSKKPLGLFEEGSKTWQCTECCSQRLNAIYNTLYLFTTHYTG